MARERGSRAISTCKCRQQPSDQNPRFFEAAARESSFFERSTPSARKRFKEDVKDVQKGYECGLTIHNFNDIKVGDMVEVFEEQNKK